MRGRLTVGMGVVAGVALATGLATSAVSSATTLRPGPLRAARTTASSRGRDVTPRTLEASPLMLTNAETTGGVTHTWTNYTNAGGTEGPTIPSFTTVQITCA